MTPLAWALAKYSWYHCKLRSLGTEIKAGEDNTHTYEEKTAMG